ncbi:Transglutaminase-like, partial [Dillenia turbinata]
MVARRFLVQHKETSFDVEYDTEDGFEVLKFQLFSLTSIPPDEQKICVSEDDRILSEDSDLTAISDKLRLISIDEDSKEEEKGQSSRNDNSFAKSDEELARLLQGFSRAIPFTPNSQQFLNNPEDQGQFEKKIRPYVSQVLMYEDPNHQAATRKTVPINELEEKALVSLAKEGNFRPSKNDQDHAFLLQLLFWFKQSFSWVHTPPCEGCGGATLSQGMGVALPSELLYGGARVELYRCNFCSRITRFPRYNDPLKLVETRRGRCGEWANCFTLYCRAFGYEARLFYGLEFGFLLDVKELNLAPTFSQQLQKKVQGLSKEVLSDVNFHWHRWMHLDPCEGIYDKPLLYEKGWNKKLNYVIAIAKDGVYDVTKRYTRKWHEVLSRRNITTENTLSAVVSNITKECRKGFTSQLLSTLEDRDRIELEALERDLRSVDDGSISLPGRLSGDKEWRIARSEFGSGDSTLSSSSCPVRVCKDEHVTRIYDTFFPILFQSVENSLSRSEVVEIIEILKDILMHLKNLPFRTRKASSNSFAKKQNLMPKMLPSFGDLFEALSLKGDFDSDGRIHISLAGDPVKTSLSLPVVLDALDELIRDLKRCNDFNKDSLTLPLLKLNRISSGTVLASGEELPFGIATAAFDGSHLSKWEEPNGARGSWITYKVMGQVMHELVAYEFMTANDCPERDPMEWVVEGSADGGSTWHVLDKQNSQMFDERFQRKTYQVKSTGIKCNLFRFLAVRDAQENSRLQLGSIDLY